jgi:hypothetical protein
LGAWQVSAQTLDSAGRVVSNGIGLQFDKVTASCPGLASPLGAGLPNQSAMQDCIRRAGIHVVAAYQPADRYWTFQAIEAALFVALAGGLMVLSVWWVRSRPG